MELLEALTRFMTKQYNVENIKFLRAVRRVNAVIDDAMASSPMLPINRFEEQKLDSAIVAVYRSFIAEDTALQQINLKYAVKTRINAVFKTASSSTIDRSSADILSRFTIHQKRHIFDECIGEIEQLVRTSILYSFYASPDFQDIAQEREMEAESGSGTLLKMRSAPQPMTAQDVRMVLRMAEFSVPTAMDSEFNHYAPSSFLCAVDPEDNDDSKESKTTAHTATLGTANMSPMMRSCLSSPYSSMSPRVSPCSLPSLPQSDTRLSVDISSHEFADDLGLGLVDRFPTARSGVESVDKLTPYQSHDLLAVNELDTDQEEDSFPFDDEKEQTMQQAARFILQPFESVMDDHVHFGNVVLAQNGCHYIFDAHGLSKGVHQWEIQILQMDRHILQEIGVVSTEYIERTVMDQGSVQKQTHRGARAVIGHQSRLDDSNLAFMYYGSWNADGKKRCFRDLSRKQYRTGWKVGDILKVKLDLKYNKIRFFLNDEKVRSSLSLQSGKTYHPFISFTGNCQYKLLCV